MAGAIAEIARQTLAAGLPPHRSAHGAHRAGRGRAAHAAGLSREACPTMRRRRSLSGMGVEVLARHAGRPTATRAASIDRGRAIEAARHLGGRRGGVAGGANGSAPRTIAPGASGRARPLGARPSRHIRRSATPPPSRCGRPAVPGLAPAAKQMGRYVGRLIAARVARRAVAAAVPLSPPGQPRHHRPQGRGRRISAGCELTGFLGWLLWSVVAHLLPDRLAQPLRRRLHWLWEYLTFQRGARLITEVSRDDPR